MRRGQRTGLVRARKESEPPRGAHPLDKAEEGTRKGGRRKRAGVVRGTRLWREQELLAEVERWWHSNVRAIGTVGTRKENKSEPVMGIQSERGKKGRGTGKGRGRVGQDAESKRAFARWRGQRKMRK